MITLDFETKSYADLKKVGAWAYSKHPTTDIIWVSYGIDDLPVQSWWPGKEGVKLTQNMPLDLYLAVVEPQEIEAHNVAFEWSIWVNVLCPRYGWIKPLPHQMRDTMAVAAYYGLPRGLDKLAHTLGFEGKDPRGSRLITKYSKLYLKTASAKIPPEDLKAIGEYCEQDVRIEQSVSDFLGDLPKREVPVFLLNQKVNRRGLLLDVEGIEAASEVVDKRAEELTAEFRELTGLNPTQRDKVMDWFKEQGVELENMQAKYLEELLEEDDEEPESLDARRNFFLPADARKALEIRLKINKASTKKLDSMARQVDPDDGRARFQTIYHGAGTGRETGTGFQPLNMNRGFEDMDPAQLTRDIMYRDPEFLDMIYGDAMDAVGKATRHWIKASEGSVIMAGDFVSVEAVVLACLAGEQWKIDAFADDAPIYCITGCKVHSMDPAIALELGDKEFKKRYPDVRKDGKTSELAGGYQGALGAWRKFDSSDRHSDESVVSMIKAWRAEHLMIVALWRGLERAALDAVVSRETKYYRDIGFEIVDDWLTMILPDGKRLWYWKPEVRMGMPAWHKPREIEECANGSCDCRPVEKLSYMAMKEGQWKRVYTYGGKLTENATQATSRQILMTALQAVSDAWDFPLMKAGYIKGDESAVILSVYDEIVAEVPKGFTTVDEFSALLMTRPDFAKHWPIRVDAWEGERYKK